MLHKSVIMFNTCPTQMFWLYATQPVLPGQCNIQEGNVLFNDALNNFFYGFVMLDVW